MLPRRQTREKAAALQGLKTFPSLFRCWLMMHNQGWEESMEGEGRMEEEEGSPYGDASAREQQDAELA